MEKCVLAAVAMLSLALCVNASEQDIIDRLNKIGVCCVRINTTDENGVIAVFLQGKKITDMDLNDLCELRHLRHLFLIDTSITNQGLHVIGTLSQLKGLRLSGKVVSDESLHELRGLRKSLRMLKFNSTNITDSGLLELTTMSHLQELCFDDCPGITDAGIDAIARITSLEHLCLKNVRVTDEGVERLRAALPRCTIDRLWNKE